MKNLILTFLICFNFIGISPVFTQPVDYLDRDDVSRIMQDILGQHVREKKITKDILKNSFRVYIEQFDPEKVYLLKKEAEPFLNPSESRLHQYLEAFERGNFRPYQQIDLLIKKSIERSRRIRAKIFQNPDKLFTANTLEAYRSTYQESGYPNNKEELSSRLNMFIVAFIQLQKEKYGAHVVMQRKDAVLKLLEKEMGEWENPYLYVSDEGRPLSRTQKEHQFTLHVLKSLAKSLDSHTSFFDQSEATDMRMRLHKGYIGTGIILEEGIDGFTITAIEKESPAEREEKINVGDVILSIDGRDVGRLSLDTVRELLEGERGSTVKFRIQGRKNGYQYTYATTLKREMITLERERVKSDYVQFGDGIIAKIELNSFYANRSGVTSEKDVRNAIESLREHGPIRGLILDLRNNAGGYLSQAVKVAGLFVTNGVIVISKYSDGERRYYRDIDGRTWFDGPLIVLTSRLTASAAEIVAQALQDYGVAIVVGDDRTYGKGSIQSQNVTQNQTSNSFFKVTVGKYYTVSGKTPQVKGVLADIVVPGEFSGIDYGEQYQTSVLKTDQIEPSFQDRLLDVRPDVKQWFLRYYMPTLQPKKTSWQKMIPDLKKRSEARLRRNFHFTSSPSSPYLTQEEQMAEAVNIVKDMVKLRSQMNKNALGIYE